MEKEVTGRSMSLVASQESRGMLIVNEMITRSVY